MTRPASRAIGGVRGERSATRVIASGCTGLLLFPAAVAQQPPDAGQIRQEIERRSAPKQPLLTQPGAPRTPPAAQAPAESGETVVVLRRVDFIGNTRLDDTALQSVVEPYLHRPLRFTDIQRAASDVAARFRSDGWIVRTALPEQDLGDGVLRIVITEGRFGKVVVDAGGLGDELRVSAHRILGLASSRLQPGQLLRASDIDAAIRLVDDLPGIRAQGQLEAGASDGLSDLRLRVTGEPLTSVTWGVDNQGGRSTGALRATGSIILASPSGLAERISVSTMGSEGNRYARAAVQWPVGDRGTRAGWSGSWLQYRLTDPSVSMLDAQGWSATAGMDVSHPLVRTADQTWTIGASAERKWFHNEAAGSVTSAYRVDNLQLTAGGYRSDAVLGGGVTGLSAGVTLGRVRLDGSPSEAADAQGARTAGAYAKLRWSLSRQQRLGDALGVSASWTGQRTNRNLDSSERLYIGGPGGVRAYPAGEAGGPEGDILNLELQSVWRPGLELSAFVDRGRVRADAQQGSWVSPGPARVRLQGIGSAMSWSPLPQITAKVVWSRRVGLNPNPTAAGTDQDGTRRINRVWLELAGTF